VDRKIVRANEPFSVQLADGRPLDISAGDLFWSDDPMVKTRGRLFGDVSIRTSTGGRESSSASGPGAAVETATADPGVRRRMTRPKDESDEV